MVFSIIWFIISIIVFIAIGYNLIFHRERITNSTGMLKFGYYFSFILAAYSIIWFLVNGFN